MPTSPEEVINTIQDLKTSKCIGALMSITENIQTPLNDNKYVAGAFVYLKKAIDAVEHDILIHTG